MGVGPGALAAERMLTDGPDLLNDHETTLYPYGGWWIPWAPEDGLDGNHTPTVGDIRLPAPPDAEMPKF